MKPDIEKLRKKYMDNPPEGMSSRDIRRMSEEELQFKRAPKAVFPIKIQVSNLFVISHKQIFVQKINSRTYFSHLSIKIIWIVVVSPAV